MHANCHVAGDPSRAADLPRLLRQALLTVPVRPRVAMALKAAGAAGAAWAVVQPIGGVVENYPYYAPFGAVVAVSTTVVSSARESARSIVAILLGAATGILLDAWLGTSWLTVAGAVAIGTLLAGWRRLGPMGSWVPISALFVLILGHAHPGQYVAAYAGLTGLGAALGVAVNLLFPPLPLDAAAQAVDRLRETLAGQFEDLAEALLAEERLGASEWHIRADAVESASTRTRETIQEAAEAERANWRARRWRERARRQYDAAMTLEQLPFIVKDVTAIIVHDLDGPEGIPWGDALRPRIAHVLQATADLLRSIDATGAGVDELASFDEALEHLVDEVRNRRETTGNDLFGVASLITTLRRARLQVRPRDDETSG